MDPSLHSVPNAKTAYGLMMLLHASLAFISVEIRFHSDFAELSLEMGLGEQDVFLISSVSLGLLPLILEVSEMSPTEISVIGSCWFSDPAPISSCLIIVDIGELWSKLGASIQWTIKINNNHKTALCWKTSHSNCSDDDGDLRHDLEGRALHLEREQNLFCHLCGRVRGWAGSEPKLLSCLAPSVTQLRAGMVWVDPSLDLCPWDLP